MRHAILVTKLGRSDVKEVFLFDSDLYSREEAEACFRPYKAITQNGYPYIGYEYDGQKYHDITYLGEYENGKEPRNYAEFIQRQVDRDD